MSRTLVRAGEQERSRSVAAVVLAMVVAARPKQWTKNLVLFVGLVFSLNLLRLSALLEAVAAFVAFCALSSAAYLVNDVIDLPNDRAHPIKARRPLASGRLTVGESVLAAVALFLLGLGLAWALDPLFAALALAYVALTLAYSLHLKKVVLLDVFSIAAGFVLRAAAGAVVVSVPISPWLYVCTILLALLIALGKRRNELHLLEDQAVEHRTTLKLYTADLLDQLIVIISSAAIMAYSLYTFSAENLPKNHAMMVTIPLVVYGIFRYLYVMRVLRVGGSPEDLLLSDRPLGLTVLCWAFLSVAILYLVPR